MKPFIQRGTVYEPLENEDFFKKRLFICVDTIAWDINGSRDEYECVDVAPEIISESPMLSDIPEDEVL